MLKAATSKAVAVSTYFIIVSLISPQIPPQ